MKQVAYVFGIISAVLSACAIIPLFWIIPMVKRVKRADNNEDTLGVGFKVCYLLFVSTVGGILLLCDKD